MAVCIELLTRIVDAPTNPSVRLVQLAEANGLPSLRTGARRQDRALSGRELGILLPLHDTALIDMTSGRIIPLLSFSALCCLILRSVCLRTFLRFSAFVTLDYSARRRARRWFIELVERLSRE